MKLTIATLLLALAAMVYAGPAESHHDHLCTAYAPNPRACERH